VTSTDPELLDRTNELAAVEQAIVEANSGRGRLLLLEGPAGIGKSELIRRARRMAAQAGLRSCTARGGELESEFSFGVVRQLFEGSVRELEPTQRQAVLAGPARHVAPMLGLSGDVESADVLPLLHGLYWLTANLAGVQPLLVAVDDAHWADAVSLRYVEYLTRRVDDLPVLVIAAARPAQTRGGALVRIASDPNSQVVRPSPLTQAAVASLVATSLDGPADVGFTQACFEATGGNPFLVRHLLATLRSTGLSSSAEFTSTVLTTAPDAVTRSTRTRLASLGASATRLAEAVAVLGDDAALAMAADLAELDPSAGATAADLLTAVDILGRSRRLGFAHPLVRSVVYEDIPQARRSTMHRQAARLIAEAGLGRDRIAGQLLLTHPTGDAWVVDQLRGAAAAAVDAGDPETAGRRLRRALAEPAPAELRAELLCALGTVELRSHAPGAIEHLYLAHELAADARLRVAVVRRLMLALMGGGRADEAVHLLDPAIAEATALDEDLGLQVEAEVISLARLMARPQIGGHARSERRHAGIEGRTPGERLLLADLCIEEALGGSSAGQASRTAERALGDGALLSEQTADTMPFYQAVYVLAGAQRLDRAAKLLDVAIADAVARGSQLGFALASLFRSYVELVAGRVGAAEAEAANALRAADDRVWSTGFPACVAAMVDVLAVQGRTALAERLLHEHDLHGPLPDSLPHRVLLHSRAQLRVVAGDVAGALADYDEFDRREAAGPTLHPWLNNHRLGVVTALVRAGRVPEAHERAAAAVAAARQWGTNHAVGRAQMALAATGPADEAAVNLTQAVALLAESPARLDLAAAFVELGALQRRSGARAAAEDALSRGLDLASRVGSTLLAERARSELVALGRRPRRAALTGIDALTGSERRVADLAAGGMSNREIAQSLFVTTRTVETHLSSAYRKLGIESRSDLADALAR
jgi:DNA-binding CsgD family transcriptional regulator